MLFNVISLLLKLLLIGVVMAIELSVALPVVSLTILLLFLRDLGLVGKTLALVVSALILSSFTGLAWSVVFVVLAFCWLGSELVRGEKARIRNRVILMSLAATVFFAWAAHMNVTTRSLIYTVIFCIVAVIVARMFVHQRSRNTFIEWIAPGT
jgi:hypothetical protein